MLQTRRNLSSYIARGIGTAALPAYVAQSTFYRSKAHAMRPQPSGLAVLDGPWLGPKDQWCGVGSVVVEQLELLVKPLKRFA